MLEKNFTPAADGFHMPGEYEPHDGCIIVWPQRPGSWSFGAVAACEAFTAVIKAIAASEKVYVICGAKHFAVAQEYLAGVANVELLAMETDDSWARDIGPTFVVRDGAQGRELRGVNWRFNAWGGEVDGLYPDYEQDDAFAEKFAEHYGAALYDAVPFVLEGGSIHCDGEGTALVTEACLLSAGRNSDLSKEQIEQKLKTYLGVEKVLWIPRGMSEHHRRAYKLLSGAPQTLSKQGIWTFGAPSVLGLYLRTGCSLRQTVEDMQECMPPYYLLSGWHGAGAAELTEAEALLLQGRIDEMDMPLQKAYYQAEKHGQECITICCDFLEMQRDLFRGVYSSKAEAYSRHQWQLQPWKQSMLLNSADMCAGFYYALLGKPEYIPSWLTDGNGQQPSVLYPARPCRNYISAQCLLAQGQYTELLVRWSDWEQECRPYSNFLCLLYLQVQRAAAFAGRGDVTSCRASLKQALAMAEADKLVLPLAQNIALLRPYLEQEAQGECSAAAAAALYLGQQMEAGRGQIMSARFAEAGLQELTEQELQIAQLAAARHTNREIAQRLSLSEGTIKQYLNKIFAKLQIDAAAKNKRHQLERFFSNS